MAHSLIYAMSSVTKYRGGWWGAAVVKGPPKKEIKKKE
jgi:hypothetical protein